MSTLALAAGLFMVSSGSVSAATLDVAAGSDVLLDDSVCTL